MYNVSNFFVEIMFQAFIPLHRDNYSDLTLLKDVNFVFFLNLCDKILNSPKYALEHIILLPKFEHINFVFISNYR